MASIVRLTAPILLLLFSRLASAEEDPNFRRGLIYFKSGKYADSAQEFRRTLTRNPQDPDAHLWLGKTYARMEDFEKAIEHLQQARDLRPEDEGTYRELGDAYLHLADRAHQKSQLDRADTVGQALLKLPPKEKESYQFLIDLCLQKAKALQGAAAGRKHQDFYGEALGYCEKALAIDPNWISISLQRIRILVDMKRFKEAERRCQEVIKFNPRLIGPRIRRPSSDPGGALEILTRFINEHETQIQALLLRAEIYLDQERYEEALTDASEVLSLISKNAPMSYIGADVAIRIANYRASANFLRGCAFVQLKKLDPAIAEFQQAAAQMPKHFATHIWLARCYLMKDHIRDALDELNTVLRIDPRYVPARLLLARAHLQQGYPDLTIPDLADAAESDPRNTELLRLLGIAYLHKGDYDRAARFFEKIIDLDPALTQPRYELARLYGLQRQFDKAQALLDEVRKVEPDKAKVQKAIDELARQRAEPPKAAPE